MIRKITQYMKLPAILFFSAMVVGTLVGLYLISPEVGEKVANLSAIKTQKFFEIALNNCGIVLFVYLSVVFSKKYAYFIYCFNGITLGIIIGWIINSNLMLLLLILPHGIFEIPNILATGYIVNKGENYVRKNFKSFIKVFLYHQIITIFCAFVEAFITPYFQQFV